MKVCHVITRLILGGAQENTILTCEGLAARGHEVTLVTGPALGPEGELMTRALAGGYCVIVLDELRREIHVGRDWRSLRRLKRLFHELQPDVVHSHSSKAGILARKAAAKVGGMNVVHTIHGLPFHPYESKRRNRVYIALERLAARRTDAMISVADAMTAQALAAGVGRPEQYQTIYSGMEVEPFLNRPPEAETFRAKLGLPAEAALVMQISRLAELKGHEHLLDAAGRLDERIHFCFVGDGHLRGAIEEDIARRGLTDRVHLAGLLSPDDIPAAVHAADMVVHCSLREGLARALPQAMLAGKPVVSFDVDGAREIVSDQTGALIRPADTDALTDAIARLADSPGRRHAMGVAGRDLCQHRFDHHVMVDQIEELYERLSD